MRPVEGALTIHSNRFLKLETHKDGCEYPKWAFNDEKKTELLKAAEKKELTDGAKGLSDGVVELFRMTEPITERLISDWCKLMDDCAAKKKVLLKAIEDLDEYRNDVQQPSCKDFAGLKETLWKKSDYDKELTEADMGFTDNVVVAGAEDALVSDDCVNRMLHNNIDLNVLTIKSEIISNRKSKRREVLQAAIELRKAIVLVLKFEMTQKDVDKMFGFFRWTTLPKDAKKIMCKAISKDNDNCKKMLIYHMDNDLKDLTDPRHFIDLSLKRKWRRVFCLNLLKELKLDQKRSKIGQGANAKVPDEPKKAQILDETIWKNYVDSLTTVPKLEKEKNLFGQTIKDAFAKQFSDAKDAVDFKKSYQEMFAWADGNPGGILLTANNNTYRLGDVQGKRGNIVLTKIESYQPFITESTAAAEGEVGKAVGKFLDQIKDELKSI